jgi:hypothetical protein
VLRRKVKAASVAAIAGVVIVLFQSSPAAATYDWGSAMNYAETYCGVGGCPYDNNSSYGSRFDNDCANFVSQSLIAGGFPMHHPNWSPSDWNYFWNHDAILQFIYSGYPDNSHSASVANSMFNMLAYSSHGQTYSDFASYYGLGPNDPLAPYQPNNTWEGDPIFYNFDRYDNSDIDHVTIVVGHGVSSAETWYWEGTYVNAHTSDRQRSHWTLTPHNPAWATTVSWSFHIEW